MAEASPAAFLAEKPSYTAIYNQLKNLGYMEKSEIQRQSSTEHDMDSERDFLLEAISSLDVDDKDLLFLGTITKYLIPLL